MMIDRSTAVSTPHRRRIQPAGWSLCPQPSDDGGEPSSAESKAVKIVPPSDEAAGGVSPETEEEAALPVTGPAKKAKN
jgi:hypothetical protein